MTDTRIEILKELEIRVPQIRWALNNGDWKFGLNHLSHLERILEENIHKK